MHLVQRRRRERLRRRVASGEIDLEQLGIKRLTVPRSVLDTMAVYTYPDPEKLELYARPGFDSPTNKNGEIQPTTAKPQSTVEPTEKELETGAVGAQKKVTTTTRQPQTMSAATQPTCAICLEDFVPLESTVRELPCRHIFHADCIDPFLRENSSLCPLCKKTSLPKGYCPPVITNAMVRRERMMRRMRTRVQRQQAATLYPWWNPLRWVNTLASHAAREGPGSNTNRMTQRWTRRRWPGAGIAAEISRRRGQPANRGQPVVEDVELGHQTAPECVTNPPGTGVIQPSTGTPPPEVLSGANEPISEEITAASEQPIATATQAEQPIATAVESEQPTATSVESEQPTATTVEPEQPQQVPAVESIPLPTEPITLPLPDEDDEPPRPRWRRALSVVWPGVV
jgi:hypothetical protein